MSTINVILSGGVGSRLWPLSRKSRPKQYLPIFDGETLFQKTALRNKAFCEKVMVVGNCDNYELSRKDLENSLITDFTEIIEACPRNTAAAIAFAAFAVDHDDILFVTPSDHLIDSTVEYQTAVNSAIQLAQEGFIVTFGLKPSKPETGFGYIEAVGEEVKSFREKPNLETAEEFLKKGNFFWNSGMFCFKAGIYLDELLKYEPEVFHTSKGAFVNSNLGKLDFELSMAIPSISVDYAVMEKTEKIKDDTKLYSFSISKSFVSYILGEAICNGHIKSLEDKISVYVPETKGTVYENSTLKELINMSAGDTKFSSRKPGSANLPYASKVVGTKETTVKDYLNLSTGVKLSKKEFNYNNLLTDLVARAIDTSVPGGLKKSYESLANKSGTGSEMYFLTDDNGWPLLHAWFYATREDFLRLAIQVSQDWNSKSCIGNYLNKIENMKIDTEQDKSEYSGYFWYDQEIKSRHVQMRGHGGQRIHIDLEKGSILIYHAITKDYDNKSIWNLIKN